MITRKQIQYLCKMFSIVATFLYTGLLFYMWYMAYFGGTQSVLMTINVFNEMMIEFYTWLITIPIIVYGFVLNYKEVFYGKGKA